MLSEELILKYFPDIDRQQIAQFEKLQTLYTTWNAKINVISRKDMEHFYLHHVLHALGIAKVIDFPNNSSVLDVGTGGGFPGIPLAILYPNVDFCLVDAIGKKIKVCQSVVDQLNLNNVTCLQQRVETMSQHYDFITSRAVTRLDVFLKWTKHLLSPHPPEKLKRIYCLKGGDLAEELANARVPYNIYQLSKWFEEPFFETKKVVAV